MRNRIKVARESRQLNQANLAKLVGVSRQTLSAIEANKHEPSLQTALRIAQILQLPVEQLFVMEEIEMETLTSQLQTYQTILDFVFGAGSCTINCNQVGVNNLVGAISREKDSIFESLRSTYVERLHRLKTLYESDEHCYTAIKRLAQEVGTGDGVGAYAELGAIDYVARMFRHIIGQPATLNVDLPAVRTFAGFIQNRQTANLDGYIEDLNTYFDVKTLQDVTDGILRKPIRELSAKYNANILPERDYAYEYSLLQKHLRTIRSELEQALISKATYLQVKCVKGLGFRISWPPGVSVASGILDPYKASLIRHKGVFDYADKFVLDAPFMLVLVTPPWTDTNLTNFEDIANTFYRALSRRIFCQYLNSDEIHPEYKKTYGELSKAISMILFLKLHDGLGEEKDPIEAQVFANPNATHRYPGFLRDFFYEQRIAVQSLEWDNY